MSTSEVLAGGTSTERRVSALGWRHVLPVTGGAVVGAALYAGGVVVPYYVNDLDRLSLAEVASGAHDPMGLWPHGSAAAWTQLAGIAGIALVPVVGVLGALWCLGVVLGGRGRLRSWTVPAPVAVVSAVTGVVCVGLLVFVFSPVGVALSTWRMD